ncbi:hypothetical protein ABIB15_001514 [Marisediminicola sp. UYEF4]
MKTIVSGAAVGSRGMTANRPGLREQLGIERSRRIYALFHRSFREDPDIVLDGAVLKVGNFRANLSFNIGAILGRELLQQAFGHVPDDLFNLGLSSHTRSAEVRVAIANQIMSLHRHSLRRGNQRY